MAIVYARQAISRATSFFSPGPEMRLSGRAVFGLFLLAFTALAGAQVEHERLAVRGEGSSQDWKVGRTADDAQRRTSLVEFIRPDDDINAWKELFTVASIPPPRGGIGPDRAMQFLQAVSESRCPNTARWTVIEKDDRSVLYEVRRAPCLTFPDIHELGRVLIGKYNLFQVVYATKQAEMATADRTSWIKTLAETKIETYKEVTSPESGTTP